MSNNILSKPMQQQPRLATALKELNFILLSAYLFFIFLAAFVAYQTLSTYLSTVWLTTSLLLIYLFVNFRNKIIDAHKQKVQFNNDLKSLSIIIVISGLLWSLIACYSLLNKSWDHLVISLLLSIFSLYALARLYNLYMSFIIPLLLPSAAVLIFTTNQEYFYIGLYTLAFFALISLLANKVYKTLVINDNSVLDALSNGEDLDINTNIPNINIDNSLQDNKHLSEVNVLIVEDNIVNQNLMYDLLSGCCNKVYIANNGQEAVALASNITVDCIFMDIQMPILDGYEATKQIRKLKQYAHVPIIAITANTYAGHKDKCLHAGATDYLNKPVEASTLFSTLKHWLQIPADNVPADNVDSFKARASKNPKANTKLNNTQKNTMINNNPPEDQQFADENFNPIEARKFFLNKNIYLDTLNLFINNQQDIIVKLNKSLQEDNFELLKRQIHTLKGLSLQIGAQKLHNCANKIDAKLREQLTRYEEIEQDLKDLEFAHEPVIQAVKQYVAFYRNNLGDEKLNVTNKNKTVDKTKLDSDINKLIHLIKNYDTQAVELLKTILEEHQTSDELLNHLKNILSLLQLFEYDKAIQVCDKLLSNEL